MKQLILASESPRRRILLDQAGLTYDIRPSGADERIPDDLSAAEAASLLAERKAAAVHADAEGGAVVLGADTIVACDGRMMGKPADDDEAENMLRYLSGRTHQVHTGAAVLSGMGKTVFTETVDVTFYPLTDVEIKRYIASNEPADKAGAYGIQGLGAVLVKRIHGDYYAVVGLPLGRVVRVLQSHGIT
ncbi:Maf family protein [Alkalicoccus chagannorensis]|uniref:Maf family protein n=1 Tax=Alkalicoccus chagannorensis TaxID=427072 RepID=UPI0004075353|nr:Maf family protein [Alkalicoccus chagannorensis]